MTFTDDIEEQARRWFARLSDVDAPVSEWSAFQDWLEQDDAHRLAYDAVERIWVELDGPESPAILSRVAAYAPRPARGRRGSAPRRGEGLAGRTWLFPAVAAAAALALAIGVWPPVGDLLKTRTYRTDDQAQTIVLADGSHIYLNRHSVLSVRMKPSGRIVNLADGEAGFDVTHDPARPFVVRSGDHDVSVLGTAFNLLNHADRFSVGVERGMVAVRASHNALPVHLAAGERIDQVGSGSPVLSRLDPAQASSWRQGVLIYRDAPLGEVADDLSRYLDKPVTIAASAEPLRFTGALRTGDEATMLNQLQAFVPVRAIRSSGDVRLTARGAE